MTGEAWRQHLQTHLALRRAIGFTMQREARLLQGNVRSPLSAGGWSKPRRPTLARATAPARPAPPATARRCPATTIACRSSMRARTCNRSPLDSSRPRHAVRQRRRYQHAWLARQPVAGLHRVAARSAGRMPRTTA